MKTSKFTVNQIGKSLREHEGRRKTQDMCRELSISSPTFYRCKRKYGGMEARDLRHLKDLEHENSRLKQLVADRNNHINRIENFWNQANRHLGKFNGIKPENFHWFLKECEWRVNGGNHAELLKQLKYWYKQAKH